MRNTEHTQRFTASLERYRFARRGTKPDRYWQAMLWVVTATADLWAKIEPFIEMERGNAWLTRALNEVDLSSGERYLVELAANLYGDEIKVDLSGLINYLDDDMWSVALEAMRIRLGDDALR